MTAKRFPRASAFLVSSIFFLAAISQEVADADGIRRHNSYDEYYDDDGGYFDDYLDDNVTRPPPENLFCSPKELPKFGDTINTEHVVSFYAMGDIPTYMEERYCLNKQLRDLDTTSPGSPSFIVHVGDIKPTGKLHPCNYEAYNDIAEIFMNNALNYDPRDCFFMPGDNEWVDCRPADSEEIAFEFWKETFGPNNKYGFGTLSSGNVTVARQTSVRSENFAFFLKGVLFTSVNIVGGKPYGDEELRFAQNLNWTRDQLAIHKPQGMKACVIFAHAFLKRGIRRHFYGEPLFDLIRKEYRKMPVMYLHGDGHEYCVRYPDPNNDFFVDIMVDEGKYAPPLKISILKHPNKQKYKFEIDRRGGYYDGDCPEIREKTWDSPGLPSLPKQTDSTTSQPTTPPTEPPTTSETAAPTSSPTPIPALHDPDQDEFPLKNLTWFAEKRRTPRLHPLDSAREIARVTLIVPKDSHVLSEKDIKLYQGVSGEAREEKITVFTVSPIV